MKTTHVIVIIAIVVLLCIMFEIGLILSSHTQSIDTNLTVTAQTATPSVTSSTSPQTNYTGIDPYQMSCAQLYQNILRLENLSAGYNLMWNGRAYGLTNGNQTATQTLLEQYTQVFDARIFTQTYGYNPNWSCPYP